MATAAMVREMLFKAKRYLEDKEKAAWDEDTDEPDYDMKCEALLPVLRRELPVHVHAHRADDIATAMRICREFGLRYVLVHGTEGHLIADYLKREGVSVICGPMLNTRTKPELSGFTMEGPALLAQAGIPVSICTDHPEIPEDLLPAQCRALRPGGAALADGDGGHYLCTGGAGGHRRPGRQSGSGAGCRCGAVRRDPLSLEARPALVMINGKIVHKNFIK